MLRREFEKKEKPQDASKLVVGIAVADFNADITGALLDGALKTLHEWGVREKNIHIMHTFGSFELPFAAARLAKRRKLGALVAIGCIVKGETAHDMHLAQAVMHGLTRVSLDRDIPVGLAVLTVNTLAQARARSRGATNHGAKAAAAALRAALA